MHVVDNAKEYYNHFGKQNQKIGLSLEIITQ